MNAHVLMCGKGRAAVDRHFARRVLSPMRDEHYDCPTQWDRLRLSDIVACASETCELVLSPRRIDIRHSRCGCPGVQSFHGVRAIVRCAID